MNRIDPLIAEHHSNGIPLLRLGDVAVISRGASPRPIQDFLTDSADGMPWIKIGDVPAGGKYITSTAQYVSAAGALKSRRVRPGDFVLTNSMSFGRPYISKIDGYIHDGWLSISDFNKSFGPDYLYYLLGSPAVQAEFSRRASTGTVRNLNADIVKSVIVPVPCIEIQREIVEALNQFTRLEAVLVAGLEARRRQYAYYRPSILAQPAASVTVKLREVVEFQNAKPHEKLIDPGGDITLLTPGFIASGSSKARFVNAIDVLTPARLHDVALVMSDLPNGRALAKAFFVGKADAFAANQRVCLLRSLDLDRLDPKFLFYIVDRNRQLLAYDSGVDQTHLKKDWILDIELEIPSLAEQRQVVARLDEFEKLIGDLEFGIPAEIAARRKQYEYYRDRLLTFSKNTA